MRAYRTHKLTERGKTHRTAARSVENGTNVTACGKTAQEDETWHAGSVVDCRACLRVITCPSGRHEGDCPTPVTCRDAARR